MDTSQEQEDWRLKEDASNRTGDSSGYYSQLQDVTNPFDSVLAESLHKHTFSPSVFKDVNKATTANDTPKNGGHSFRWSIDHIAVLNPAEIDEYPIHQSSEQADPEMEAKLESAIEEFWASHTHIAPSPQDEPAVRSRFARQVHAGKRLPPPTKHMATQTLLSFPVDFDLCRLLDGCFEYNEEMEGSGKSLVPADLNVSGLRRKLFSPPGAVSPPPATSSVVGFLHPVLCHGGIPDGDKRVAF